MRALTMLGRAALSAAVLLATTSGLWAFCDSNIETYALFQCAEVAYFEPVPAPFGPSDVTGVFWQIGFGNRTLNTGQGQDGTGVESKSSFNGNDSGNFPVDVLDAAAVFPTLGFPAGSVCLGSNNWANAQVDGCCDNPRPGPIFSYANAYYGSGVSYNYVSDDNILNPYYGTYFQSIGFPGYYSIGSMMDYPTAVLLRTPRTPPDPNGNTTVWFAVAAVTNMDRGNTGDTRGGTGGCPAPSNPAVCDIRDGFFNYGAVTNGLPNAITMDSNGNPVNQDPNGNPLNNVIPWQQPPSPLASITAGDPNDPNATLTLDVSWVPPTIHSDQRSVPSNNPSLATRDPNQPRDPNAAAGVGVLDIAARFGLARFQLEVAGENDPNFSAISATFLCLQDPNDVRSAPECTGPSSATIDVAATECVRIRTLFGVEPRETTTTTATECRAGRCGDIGYQIVGNRFCPGSAGCIPSQEVCNNLDDDCDGQVDEDFNIGQTCDGVGACGAGVFQCDPDPNSTGAICSTDPGGADDQSAPELCDGLDNDCDASTDEDFSLGGACNGTTGECVDPNGPSGTVECSASDPNTTQCSLDPGGSEDRSVSEVCDGLDNDCDADVDEDFNLGGACTGQGECGAGTNECDPDPNATGAICSTEPGGSQDQSQLETCDGLDEDCDGSTDEDFNVGLACGTGECATDPNGNPGIIECSDPNTSVCSTEPGGSQDQSSAEQCDGLDNDCDGQTDEDFNIGAACTGTGACGAGVLECGDPNSAICSTDPGGSQDQSITEICGNGIDDDCDGGTDEVGGAEFCDGIDNDCDGLIDEGFNIGGSCTGTGECGAGTLECSDPNSAICSTDPGGSQDQSSGELCDGLDNDCDGQADETFNLGAACTGTGQCGNGVLECDPDPNFQGATCSTDPGGSQDQSAPEQCDGLDNDCDNAIDEDFNVGQPCNGLPGSECFTDPNGNLGMIECADLSTARCSLNPGGSQDQTRIDPNDPNFDPNNPFVQESCDDPPLDNDCDGQAEEDGICAASFAVTNFSNGDTVDCSDPRRIQPLFRFLRGPYDRFKPRLAWDLSFRKKKSIKPFVTLSDPFWQPNGKKFKKACKKAIRENPAAPVFYIRLEGTDLDVPKDSAFRSVVSPVVQLDITGSPTRASVGYQKRDREKRR